MALEKTGYSPAVQGTTKTNYAIDDNGYIAPAGTTPAGQKSFSINKVSADNSLVDNQEVLDFFFNLANGVTDSLSNTMTVKWGV